MNSWTREEAVKLVVRVVRLIHAKGDNLTMPLFEITMKNVADRLGRSERAVLIQLARILEVKETGDRSDAYRLDYACVTREGVLRKLKGPWVAFIHDLKAATDILFPVEKAVEVDFREAEMRLARLLEEKTKKIEKLRVIHGNLVGCDPEILELLGIDTVRLTKMYLNALNKMEEREIR
jgi:hypothetical protein